MHACLTVGTGIRIAQPRALLHPTTVYWMSAYRQPEITRGQNATSSVEAWFSMFKNAIGDIRRSNRRLDLIIDRIFIVVDRDMLEREFIIQGLRKNMRMGKDASIALEDGAAIALDDIQPLRFNGILDCLQGPESELP